MDAALIWREGCVAHGEYCHSATKGRHIKRHVSTAIGSRLCSLPDIVSLGYTSPAYLMVEANMAAGDLYRVKAGDLLRSRGSRSLLKAEYEHLSLFYLRLADQAVINSRNDVVYETPAVSPARSPAANANHPIKPIE